MVIGTLYLMIVISPLCYTLTSLSITYVLYIGFLIVIGSDSSIVAADYLILQNIVGPIGLMCAALNATYQISLDKRTEVLYYILKV